MRAVGIKVLKNKLSEYVRLAASGETILVKDRDKVVAELGPPHADRHTSTGSAVLDDLVRRGLVTPARNRGAPLPPRKPIAPLAQVLEWLDESRSDR